MFWWAWKWQVLGIKGKSQHLGLGGLGAALPGAFGFAVQSQQLFGFIL